MTKNMKEQEKKIKELIIYISELSEMDEYYSATKLNKLLFFADFLAYRKLGKPISGKTYIKRPQGPMLKDYYDIVKEMQGEGNFAVKQMEFFGRLQSKPIALKPAETDSFTKEEMEILYYVLSHFRNHSAKDISNESHVSSLGWQAMNLEEEIPYSTALVSNRSQTKEEWEYPKTLAFDFGKLGLSEEALVTAGG